MKTRRLPLTLTTQHKKAIVLMCKNVILYIHFAQRCNRHHNYYYAHTTIKQISTTSTLFHSWKQIILTELKSRNKANLLCMQLKNKQMFLKTCLLKTKKSLTDVLLLEYWCNISSFIITDEMLTLLSYHKKDCIATHMLIYGTHFPSNSSWKTHIVTLPPPRISMSVCLSTA